MAGLNWARLDANFSTNHKTLALLGVKGGDHAASRPAPVGRDRVHHLRPVRREEQAGAEAVEGDDDRELPVGEVHRDEYQQQEARSGQQRAAYCERQR